MQRRLANILVYSSHIATPLSHWLQRFQWLVGRKKASQPGNDFVKVLRESFRRIDSMTDTRYNLRDILSGG